MTQKHQYIKNLCEENNIKEIKEELSKTYEIFFREQKDLTDLLEKDGSEEQIRKLKESIEYNEKYIKFIEKVKDMLYKKLSEGDENNNN